MAILEAIDIIKQYKRADQTVTALNRASISVNEGAINVKYSAGLTFGHIRSIE